MQPCASSDISLRLSVYLVFDIAQTSLRARGKERVIAIAVDLSDERPTQHDAASKLRVRDSHHLWPGNV